MRELAAKAIYNQGYRRLLGMKVGFVVDAVWAVANLTLGILQASVWFITLGAYYMIFSIIRMMLLLSSRWKPDIHADTPRRIERFCGIMLLVSIFILSGIVTLVMKDLGGYEYGGVLIYAMATFAFYSLTSSIVSFVKLRKCDDIIAIVNSRVNLAIALVSIFAVEIAMLTAFGTAEDAQLKFVMPILSGASIAIVIGFLGVRSVLGNGLGNPIWQQ